MPYAYDLSPFFLDSPRGPLYCLYTSPVNTASLGAVLYLHPFAEEMHKSRRMAAMQIRALAAQGYAVLQVDLTGCGDSAGDFGDASWQAWREDVVLAHDWIREKTAQPISLWGLRTGATLAVEMVSQLGYIQRLILWQPVTSGDQFINQFLRIKLASEMLADGQAQSGTKVLRSLLAEGQSVEVGGNMLSAAMANEFGRIKLADLIPPCPVYWLEVGMEASEELPPVSQRIVNTWQEKGVAVVSQVVLGDPFWVTQEITECPMLIKATSQVMSI
jgi:exosortase A-associated hydrolase 2